MSRVQRRREGGAIAKHGLSDGFREAFCRQLAAKVNVWCAELRKQYGDFPQGRKLERQLVARLNNGDLDGAMEILAKLEVLGRDA